MPKEIAVEKPKRPLATKSEFTVKDAYVYNRSSPFRWIASHVWRYKLLFLTTVTLYMTAWFSFSGSRVLIGAASQTRAVPSRRRG